MPTLRLRLSRTAFDAGGGALAAEEGERVDDMRADGGAGDGDADRLGEFAEADAHQARSRSSRGRKQ